MLFLTNFTMFSLGRHLESIIMRQVYYFSLAKLGFLPTSYVIPTLLITVSNNQKFIAFFYLVLNSYIYTPLVELLMHGTWHPDPGQLPELPSPQVTEELKEVLSTKPEDDSLTKKEEDLYLKCFFFSMAVVAYIISQL
jgi:hypothetical protein